MKKNFFLFLGVAFVFVTSAMAGDLNVNNGATSNITSSEDYSNINVGNNNTTGGAYSVSSDNTLNIYNDTTAITVTASADTWSGFYGNDNKIIVGTNATLSVAGINAIGYSNSTNNLVEAENGGIIKQASSGETISIGSTITESVEMSNSLEAVSNGIIKFDNIIVYGNRSSIICNGGTIEEEDSGSTLSIENYNCQLDITDGGVVKYDIISVGINSYATGNVIKITGTNSALDNGGGTLYLGVDGGNNTLTLDSNAALVTQLLSVDESSSSGSNTITLSNNSSITATNIQLGNGGYGDDSMTISSSSTVSVVETFWLGADAGVGSNSVIVTGTNSTLSAASLNIGHSNSSLNSLTISNGGGATFSSLVIIGYGEANCSSSDNKITVTGTGSYLSNSAGTLVVGDSGTNNTLIISDGATAISAATYVGANLSAFAGSLSSNNGILVEDSNSVLNAGTLVEGIAGGGNNITVNDGGLLTATIFQIGAATTSSNNIVVINDATVSVTNTNLTITNPYSFVLGFYSAGNGLLITNGGTLSNSLGMIGYTATASNNIAIITGSNSEWISTNGFYLGFLGGNNNLTISNGGALIVNGPYSYIGLSSSSNVAIITGTNSVFSNSGMLNIGYVGSYNSLIISNGATAFDASIGTNFTESFAAILGAYSNNNSVTIETNSSWTNLGNLAIGYYGDSNEVINNGGTLSASNIYIGYDGSENELVMNGGTISTGTNDIYLGYTTNASNNLIDLANGVAWTNQGDVFVGYAGSANEILATNGGNNISSANIYIGYTTNASNNIIEIESNSTWVNTGNIYVGGDHASGNSFLIEGGAVVTSSNTFIGDGINCSNNNITVTGAGSILSNSGVITIGGPDSGSNNSLTVEDGGMIEAASIVIRQGTLATYDTNSLSASSIVLGGGNKDAYLSLNGNLTIPTLDWKSNGLVALQPGEEVLNVTTILSTGDKGGGFDFNGISLDNNTNVLVTYQTSTVHASDCYVKGLSGYTFTDGSNNISGYLASNANVTSSINLFVTNEVTLGSLTVTSNTVTIETNETLNIIKDLVVTNAGIISNSGILNVDGSVFNNTGGTIVNNSNATMDVNGNVTNVSTVINVGTINADNFYNNNLGGYLTNSSNALVDITNSCYNYGIVYNSGYIIAGDIYNYGTWNGSGTNTMTNSNTFHQEGTLVLAPEGPTVFNGNVVSGSNAIMIEEIAGTSSGSYGQLVVNGNLTLAGAFTLEVLNGKPSSYYGQTLKSVITATDGIIGSFTTVGSLTSGLRGRLLFTNNNTEMDILLAPSSYQLVAETANQTNVAIALNSFISVTSGDQATVSTALDELSASQYPAAFNAITPQLYQSLSTISFNIANANDMALMQRLWVLRAMGSGFTMNGFSENVMVLQENERTGAGDKESKDDILIPGPDKHWGAFVDGNGIFANANSGSMLPSYNSESGGVTTGLSYQWSERLSSGFYTGYQGNYTKYTNNPQGTLVDNAVRFGLFGSYGERNGKGFYLSGLAGGAYNNYNMQRNISFSTINRTASGTPGAGELDTMLATGYDVKKGNFIFGPTSSLQYLYFGANSFNETGAQSLDLNAQGWNTSSMIYSLGSHIAYNWQVNKNITIVPNLSLNWQHEFLQNPYAINSTLNGSSPTFANYSTAPLRDTFFPSIGVTIGLGKGWDTSFSYSAVAGNQDIMSQNIFWNLGLRF